ncbi:MAG: glutamate 5-kinase [Candidatus Tectomicrobia bacterium]|uniref:Glutamate 5-kinase n=1 Tax=Tectimicrobiota bacterium TaxID=2528274 RepID=A0A933GM35_UNCTE|nr:glutamate 5-kinase [Candidatus Tectomicrobia bacterium]
MRLDLGKKVKRVIVKIGSGVITDENGFLDEVRIKSIVSQINWLHNKGLQVLIVSSGAIAAGRGVLRLRNSLSSIPQKQAAAAIGQCHLIWAYEKYFTQFGLEVAQILLTHDDLGVRERYLNARNTLLALLDYKVIPIINENDTVAVKEIKFGDNDNLSALVANLIDADLLIILSDVEGLHDSDPRTDPSAKLFHYVDKVTPQIEKLARGSSSRVGTGGMISKLHAAKKVAFLGAPTVIVNGRKDEVIEKIFSGENIGTLFSPHGDKLTSRKHWIAYTLKPQGELWVDEGALNALLNKGKSLLATGVLEVTGNFSYGASVSCLDKVGKEFGRGLVNYSSKELKTIKGHRTWEIEEILGYKYFDEVIHRDNFVLI